MYPLCFIEYIYGEDEGVKRVSTYWLYKYSFRYIYIYIEKNTCKILNSITNKLYINRVKPKGRVMQSMDWYLKQ